MTVMSDSEFQEIFERIKGFVKRIEKTINEIISNCNDAMGWLPGALADAIVSAIQTINEVIAKFFIEVGHFLTEWGVPWTLWSHGNTWTQDIGGKSSELAGQFTTGQLRTDDEWSGDAATAYTNVLLDQRKALEAIKSAADKVNSALKDMAIAIGAFWLALAIAIGSFIAELIPEAPATAFPPTAPAGAAATGVSTAKVVTLVGAIIAGLSTYAGTIVTQVSNLQNELNSNAAFPGGKWPKATNGVSGDSKDWKVK